MVKQNITIITVMMKTRRKAKLDLCFGLQRIIDINGQKITIGLEPAIIYKANKPEDIWLFYLARM
jgi:hypothetical protein